MRFPSMPKLSDRLKYLRQLKGLSQAELAEKAGTTQQAIQQAEAGQARRPRYLHALAHELDISVEWMALGHAQDEGADTSSKPKNPKTGFQEKESEVLDHFFAMPKKDQELFFEMMKMRQKQNDDEET